MTHFLTFIRTASRETQYSYGTIKAPGATPEEALLKYTGDFGQDYEGVQVFVQPLNDDGAIPGLDAKGRLFTLRYKPQPTLIAEPV